MKKIVLTLCVFLLFGWVATDALAQGKGGGARRAERPARGQEVEKAAQAAKGETAQDAAATTKQATQKAAQGKRQAEAARDKVAQNSAAATEQAGGKMGQGKAAEKGAQAKGQGHQQQLRAFEAQQQRQQAKHMERQARLARIRELAVQKGDAEMIARVDKLIGKQQQVHQRKQTQLQQQKRAMTDAESAPDPVPPVENTTPQEATPQD